MQGKENGINSGQAEYNLSLIWWSWKEGQVSENSGQDLKSCNDSELFISYIYTALSSLMRPKAAYIVLGLKKLYDRLGWEFVTDQNSPSQFPWQSEDLNLGLPILVQHSNHDVTLWAFSWTPIPRTPSAMYVKKQKTAIALLLNCCPASKDTSEPDQWWGSEWGYTDFCSAM